MLAKNVEKKYWFFWNLTMKPEGDVTHIMWDFDFTYSQWYIKWKLTIYEKTEIINCIPCLTIKVIVTVYLFEDPFSFFEIYLVWDDISFQPKWILKMIVISIARVQIPLLLLYWLFWVWINYMIKILWNAKNWGLSSGSISRL